MIEVRVEKPDGHWTRWYVIDNYVEAVGRLDLKGLHDAVLRDLRHDVPDVERIEVRGRLDPPTEDAEWR